VWLIQVWRDNSCPHCHEVAPAWEEAAKELKGVVHFGRINYDRNGVLLQFRLRQLPTIFAVTGQGEVRMMTARNGYSADEIVKFASGIVVSSSSVQRIDSRGSAQRFLSRPAHSDKVHVILFDRSDWAAYHSAAMAPAFRDWMVFAVFPRPSASDSLVQKFDINPDERTVVVVREDGSFVCKAGMRSRKVLVRFLLQHQMQLMPKVTAHNWAQICLGVGGSSQGLHTIEHLLPARRANASVCVLAMRNASDDKARAGLGAVREAAKALAAGGDAGNGHRVQFGWAEVHKSDAIWKHLQRRRQVAPTQHETVAIIDWNRGWSKAVGEEEVPRSRDPVWLLSWVQQGLSEMEEAAEAAEEIPAVALRRSPAEQLLDIFSFRNSEGGGGDKKGEGDGKGGWSTWMGLIFLALALTNFMTNKFAEATGGSSSGGRAGRSGEERQQSRRSGQQSQPGSGGARESSSSAQQGAEGRRARESAAGSLSFPPPPLTRFPALSHSLPTAISHLSCPLSPPLS
jgi:thiol-disulfide isomerase/thioredoxin